MFLLITVFSLAAGFWAYPAPAAIYKWVDETGKVHYSDKPPVTQETGGAGYRVQSYLGHSLAE